MDSTDHKYVLATTFENLYRTLLRKKGIRVLLSNLGTKQGIRVFQIYVKLKENMITFYSNQSIN